MTTLETHEDDPWTIEHILDNLERCCDLVTISHDVLAERSETFTDKDWTDIGTVRRMLDRRLRGFDDMRKRVS